MTHEKVRWYDDPWAVGMGLCACLFAGIVYGGLIRPVEASGIAAGPAFGQVRQDCPPQASCAGLILMPADYRERQVKSLYAALVPSGNKDYLAVVMEFENGKGRTVLFGRKDIDPGFRRVRGVRLLRVRYAEEGGSTRQIPVEMP